MLLTHFTALFLESAPWLLLGLVLAGMLKMFVSMSWIEKQLGSHSLLTTVKAALIGAPLPLCSCGVIPAAIALRRSGASKSATTSFLISTPETGIDSVSVSYVLLGPFMAIIRPIAAISTAIVAALLVGKDDEKAVVKKTATSCKSCCSSKKKAESTENTKEDVKLSVMGKLIKGAHYAATKLVSDIALWLVLGLFFAALIQTYVPVDFMTEWGDGLLAMLVMVVISIPMYICATASTPIAAGLLLSGISPGAVLVFMLAGPATNIATLAVVVNELGKKTLWGYLGGILSMSLFFGWLTNLLVDQFGFVVTPQIGPEHEMLPHFIVYGSGIVLAILILNVFFKKLKSFL